MKNAIGRIFQHTQKAIKAGCPADRLFLVVKSGRDDNGRFMIAWKCTRRDNQFQHPAFPLKWFELVELKLNPKKFFITSARNGATPTATFVHDSYYRMLNLEREVGDLPQAQIRFDILELADTHENHEKLLKLQSKLSAKNWSTHMDFKVVKDWANFVLFVLFNDGPKTNELKHKINEWVDKLA